MRRAGRGRAGEQRDADELAGQELLHGAEVLLGQRLGRRHERALAPVLDRAQQREQGDHRLARSDLPHQQALHRAVLGQVGVDGVGGAQLVAGGREGQAAGQPALGQLPGRVERRRAARLVAPRPAGEQRHLQREQLVEGQALPAGLGVAGLLREVHGRQGGGAVGQAVVPGGQRVEGVADRAAVLLDHRVELGRGDPVGRRVVGHRAGAGRRLLGDGVAGDLEAALVEAAVEHEARAGPVAALEPRLVEERHGERARAVGHGGDHHRLHAAAAHGARADRADLDDDRGLLADGELAERARLAAVVGQVLEQVADRRQAEGGKRLHALGVALERLREHAGPRIADLGLEQLAVRERLARCEPCGHRVRVCVTRRTAATTTMAGRPARSRPRRRRARARPARRRPAARRRRGSR